MEPTSTTIGALIGFEVLKKGTTKLTESVLSKSDGLLVRLFKKSGIKKKLQGGLFKQSQFVTHVKTLWKHERSTPIEEFYTSPKIEGMKQKDTALCIHDFPDKRILIEGVAGQGKSILLRFLAAREFSFGENLPIFIELKNVEASNDLLQLICEQLTSMGFEEPNFALDCLGKEGRLAFFLDAFDECAGALQQKLFKNVNDIALRWSDCSIFITSRPDSGAAYFSSFANVKIKPLSGNDYEDVVRGHKWYSAHASTTLEALKKSHSITQLLTTPLMVSLLLVRFVIDKTLPENQVEFFGDFFDLLIRRHDLYKGLFKRERRSTLDDSQLRRCFNAISFYSRRKLYSLERSYQDASSIKNRELFEKFAQSAIKGENSETKPQELLDDLCNITNLLVRGDNQYNYPHKSIQEFHSACYIKDHGNRSEFYKKALDDWLFWQEELKFLLLIDRHSFLTHFLIPDLKKLTVSSDESKLSRSEIVNLLNHYSIVTRISESIDFQTIVPTKSLPLYLRQDQVISFALSILGTYVYQITIEDKLGEVKDLLDSPLRAGAALSRLDWRELAEALVTNNSRLVKNGSHETVLPIQQNGNTVRNRLFVTPLGLAYRSRINEKELKAFSIELNRELNRILKLCAAEVAVREELSSESFDF